MLERLHICDRLIRRARREGFEHHFAGGAMQIYPSACLGGAVVPTAET